MSFHAANELSVAVARACGVDTDGDDVTSIEYTHQVGDLPRLRVEYLVLNPETSQFDRLVREYKVEEVEA